MSETPWPNTFEVTIATAKDGAPYLLDWPDYLTDSLEIGASDARDHGFSNLPTEPGVYRCMVDWVCAPNGDPAFPITSWRTLCTVEGSPT